MVATGVCVERWMSRLAPDGAVNYRRNLTNFVEFLGRGGSALVGLSSDELVAYQLEHKDYVILDALQDWVVEGTGRGLRYNTLVYGYTAVRSFFMHSRAMLPMDPGFSIRSDTPGVSGGLGVEVIRRVCLASSVKYRAVFLTMFTGGMGCKELMTFSAGGRASLEKQLGEDAYPIRVDQPGRKKKRNKAPFYEWLGRDAREALVAWLEHSRLKGPYIFTSIGIRPLTYEPMRLYWTSKLRELGYIEKDDAERSVSWEDRSVTGRIRYGQNLHELRDTFRTRWHLSKADPLCAEFLMGHTVDVLGYNKAMEDLEYTRAEYLKAEPWLNVISNSGARVETQLRGKVKDLQDRLSEKTAEAERLQRLAAILADPAKLERLLERV
jgi:hypothetical protein